MNSDIFRSLCDSDTDSYEGETDNESPLDYDSETSDDGNDENDYITSTWKADLREIDVPPFLCTTRSKHDLGLDAKEIYFFDLVFDSECFRLLTTETNTPLNSKDKMVRNKQLNYKKITPYIHTLNYFSIYFCF